MAAKEKGHGDRFPEEDHHFPKVGKDSNGMSKIKDIQMDFHIFREDKCLKQPGRSFFQELRLKLPWWQKHCQDQDLISIIKTGVPGWVKPPTLSVRRQVHPPQELEAARQILQEYWEVGAVQKVSDADTKYLIPWFIITKKEGQKDKVRLICDCRELNQGLHPKKFRLDHIQNIFPVLRKGLWAAKIDLKHAYFHLGLSEQLKKYVRLQVGQDIWQFEAACFGLSTLPEIWMKLMKPLQRIWRQKGMLVFIYLDDILILGETAKLVEKHLNLALDTLKQAGLQVNFSKSILHPTQSVQHLGYLLDLKEGCLRVPAEKLKTIRKELGKVLTHSKMSCRKMASILGQVRSFLTAMPFLRAFSDQMVMFLKDNKKAGWDNPCTIPRVLQDQIRAIKDLTLKYTGRVFQSAKMNRKLASDSSDMAWAGLDLQTGDFLQEFWREEQVLHINVKELRAAISTVQSLAKKGDRVHLLVDNAVTFHYFRKGGGRLHI